MTIAYQNIVGLPPGTPTNGINPGLFPFYIDAALVFEQYMPKIPLGNWMGKEATNPIVLRTVAGGQGDQIRAPKRNFIDYTNPVRDYNQVSGQAQTPTTDYDYYNIGKISYPCKIEGDELNAIGTPLEDGLKNSIVGQITDACALGLNKDVLDAALWGNYSDPATMKPSYDRIILSGNYGVSRATYNAYAGLNAALAAMTAGTTYAQNGLSATTLMKAATMASQGGNLNGVVWYQGVTIEDKLRPSKLKTYGGWDTKKWIGLFSPAALESLYLDTLFQATATARGTIISPSQPEMISGADYIGEYKGVYIHQSDDMSQYTITTGGHTYAWGMLIGAAAWEVAWAKHPSIVSQNNVIDDVMIWTSKEIRGQKALRYPAKQASTTVPVEQGIVHIFTMIS